MTKKEAAIVSAYTGILIGDFESLHEYVEDILGRPVWTHEMASDKTANEIKKKSKPDFMKIKVTDVARDKAEAERDELKARLERARAAWAVHIDECECWAKEGLYLVPNEVQELDAILNGGGGKREGK